VGGLAVEAREVKDYYRHVEDYDWTRTVDSFVGLETFFHRVRCRETLKLIRRYRDAGRYIDIGCGTALITRHLPEHSVGIDLNPRNLEKARGYARASRFILCDAEGSLSVRSESFDIAVCRAEVQALLRQRFELDRLYSTYLGMNWFFVGRRREVRR
jgi:SAM-dependent methyltransferase